MPLRVRLSIAFVAIVLVPLGVAALLVRGGISSELDKRAKAPLANARASVDELLDQYQQRAAATAYAFAIRPEAGAAVRDRRRAQLADLIGQLKIDANPVDFFLVTDPAGTLLSSKDTRAPSFAAGVQAPSIATVARTSVQDPSQTIDEYTLRAAVKFRAANGSTLGWVVVGYWLDGPTLTEVIDAVPGISLTLFVRDKVSATTLESGVEGASPLIAARSGRDGDRVGDLLVVRDKIMTSGPTMIASVSRAGATDTQDSTVGALITVVGVSVLMAALLGWLLARVTTRPLEELSEAALSVAGGRLDTKIEVRSRDEVGKLALAFNTMTDELRTYINALQDSREELKRNLTRLGDTLSSTHDLKKMLAVILETAMVTIRAEAGALMLFSSNRDELYLKVGRGLDGRLPHASVRIAVGAGVAGRVAQTGEAVHGPVGHMSGALTLGEAEPRADSVISVPLKSQGRVIGVLNLYDRVDADEFDDSDLATIRSFANQATVAIDNVLLHQEAQRLSITDGLTGLWNYRFFQMRFDQEIERASRFGRPLALLIFDLDKFKAVNDEYGHQRGDSVLIELATRVKGAIREVDTLARYGGEEFVLILPETDVEGATQAAAKICDIVRQRRFGAAGEVPIRITVSIGVAVYPDHGRTGASLVKSADSALYAAKEAGRDAYWLAMPMVDEQDLPVVSQGSVPSPQAVDAHSVATAIAGVGAPTAEAVLEALEDEPDDDEPDIDEPDIDEPDIDEPDNDAVPDDDLGAPVAEHNGDLSDAPVEPAAGASSAVAVGVSRNGSSARYPRREAGHRGRIARRGTPRRRGRS